MCSTFKVLAAALVLKRVDRGVERLDAASSIGKDKVVAYSPETEKHVGEGMSARRHLQGGADAERQHRRQSDARKLRRPAGGDRIRAVARR